VLLNTPSPGRARGTLSREQEEKLALAMIELPARINETLNMEDDYRRIAENTLAAARSCSISPRFVLPGRPSRAR